MTKAQMEIMGLALIVVLISIAMLFFIKFSVFSEAPEHKQDYTKTELASNFINTLLKTTNPNCRDLTFTELFQDVAKNWGSAYTNCQGSKNTKDILDQDLSVLLKNTLESWHIRYEFNAKTNGLTPKEIFSKSYDGGCTGEKTPKTFPIPVDASGSQVIDITLSICP